jgi:thiamine biosynthesis lipoprotein
MGTDAHVILDTDQGSDPSGAPQAQLQSAIDDIEGLEARWSRFRVDSELSRLNARHGRATIVSAETSLLLQRAVWAWRATAGRFDPTVLDAVVGAGYDRSFEVITRDKGGSDADLTTGPHNIDERELRQGTTPGCEGVLVDPRTNLVMLPPDVGIDPGGIGKGLAADLTATDAVASGATAALVSLGGDLRVAGTPPSEGWEVEVDHHITEPARINLHAGAIATSSVLRRRWQTSEGEAHHIIDPRTGSPSNGDAVAVSVVAGEAWWAEALATTILVGFRDDGFTLELDDLLGPAGALVTLSDRSQHTFGSAGHAFSLEVAA